MNYYHKIWLVCILIIAFSLRFYGITERGLFQSDEGYYLGAAKTIRSGLDWTAGRIFGVNQPPLQDMLLDKGGTIPSAAKPGFLALVVFCSLFIGMHDYTVLIVSGIAGILTVLVVFLLGRELWDKRTGLVAASILAVLNYHIAFSRAGISAAASILFVCLGLLFYLYFIRSSPPNNRYLFMAGLSIGYAFTCHYNLFLVPLIFLCFELIYSSKERCPLGLKLKRLIILGLSMALPLIIFEAIYAPTKLFIYSKGLGSILEKTQWGRFYTYFEQVIHQVSMGGQVGVADPFFYINLLLRNDGYLSLCLLGLGIIFLLLRVRKISLGGCLVLALFFVPVLFWSLFSSLQFERLFLITSPMLALIAAFGLTSLIGQRKWLLFVVILFILANGVWHSIPTIKAKSGYLEAIAYMKSHKGVKHFSSIVTISRDYVGIKNAHNLQKESINEIKELYRQGFNYLLLDQDKYLYSTTIFVKGADSVKPVFETPHTTAIFLYESFDPQTSQKILSEPKVLRIYDLGEILELVKGRKGEAY